MNLSKNLWKDEKSANPVSPNVFCADPTGVVYEGRLYIYGTNDHQQFEATEKNTYEKINSLVCFSTDDMVNWTYHGFINTAKIAPWIYASWAPSICSRVEEDGLTHFYLYFSNSGCGVGVLTANSPLGPWTSPLNNSLVYVDVKSEFGALKDCPTPFDPGVVIDDKGDGWLSFGGGKAPEGTAAMPGSNRIVKLGKDMLSFASDFIPVKAPYFYEASELNYWNGTYVYTFNSTWDKRDEWNYKEEPSTQCSMNYMTTKTPLVSDSWKYKGNYFKNPGDQGLCFSNNHTHLMEFKGQNYLFYHTLTLEEKSPYEGGFRSMCVDKLDVNVTDDDVEIKMCKGTREGVDSIKNLNPYDTVSGSTMFTAADIWWENQDIGEVIASKAVKDCAWIYIKNVDFDANGKGALKFIAEAKGKGTLEVILDSKENESVASVKLADDYSEIGCNFTKNITGKHDVYIAFSNQGSCLKNWRVM